MRKSIVLLLAMFVLLSCSACSLELRDKFAPRDAGLSFNYTHFSKTTSTKYTFDGYYSTLTSSDGVTLTKLDGIDNDKIVYYNFEKARYFIFDGDRNNLYVLHDHAGTVHGVPNYDKVYGNVHTLDVSDCTDTFYIYGNITDTVRKHSAVNASTIYINGDVDNIDMEVIGSGNLYIYGKVIDIDTSETHFNDLVYIYDNGTGYNASKIDPYNDIKNPMLDNLKSYINNTDLDNLQKVDGFKLY